MYREKKITDYVVYILLGLLVLMLLVATISLSGYYKKKLVRLDDEIQKTKMEIDVEKTEQRTEEQQLKKQVNGLDVTRVNKDTKLIETFLRKACTWRNVDDYTKMYEWLVEQYPNESESKFYTFFVDPDKMTKTDANMEYLSSKPLVVGIQDGVYKYFTEVTVSSKDKDDATGHAIFVFMCDIDSDGNLLNLEASSLGGYSK